MLEYGFFQDGPRKRFQSLLKERGIPWSLEIRGAETLVVIDEAQIGQDTAEEIEAAYDELFAMEQALYEDNLPQLSGEPGITPVTVELDDGRTASAEVPSDLLNRVLAVLSPDEFETLVDCIVRAVEEAE